MANSYFQSQEFQKTSRNAAESGLKLFVRLLGDLGVGTVKFIQGMVRMIAGK